MTTSSLNLNLVGDSWVRAFELPLRLQLSPNAKMPWQKRARIVEEERSLTHQFFPWSLRKVTVLEPNRHFAVKLIRVAPRELDGHDNLPGIFKAVTDQVAAELGLDDRDPRVSWSYGQERGKVRQYLVRVEVTATWPEAPPDERAGTALPPNRRKRVQAGGQLP